MDRLTISVLLLSLVCLTSVSCKRAAVNDTGDVSVGIVESEQSVSEAASESVDDRLAPILADEKSHAVMSDIVSSIAFDRELSDDVSSVRVRASVGDGEIVSTTTISNDGAAISDVGGVSRMVYKGDNSQEPFCMYNDSFFPYFAFDSDPYSNMSGCPFLYDEYEQVSGDVSDGGVRTVHTNIRFEDSDYSVANEYVFEDGRLSHISTSDDKFSSGFDVEYVGGGCDIPFSELAERYAADQGLLESGTERGIRLEMVLLKLDGSKNVQSAFIRVGDPLVYTVPFGMAVQAYTDPECAEIFCGIPADVEEFTIYLKEVYLP